MPTQYLYTTPLSNTGQRTQSSEISTQIASLAAVEGDIPSVQTTGSGPNTREITGVFRGRFASVLAQEVSELGGAGVDAIPVYSLEGFREDEGYYAIDQAESERIEPLSDLLHEYTLRLTQIGTRKTHRRAVTLSRADVSTSNPFADGNTLLPALPATAIRPQWFDAVDGGLDTAPVSDTTVGERVEFEQFDPTASTLYDPPTDERVPRLVYDIAYADEYRGDCRVYDTYDRDRFAGESTDGATVGSATVGNATVGGPGDGVLQWGRVYRTSHEFAGAVVIGSGAVRVTLDDRTGDFRVEEPTGSLDSWRTFVTGTSSWGVVDVDLTSIGLASVRAQITFASAGETYPLNLTLTRGSERPLWTIPDNENRVLPEGLQSLLRPVASPASTVYDPSTALQERQSLRR